METDAKEALGEWTRRGAYFLVMGIGAFFVYFNESYGWVKAPDYPRISDFWFDPLEPYIQPYLPAIAMVLGVLFLGYSCYCFYRHATSNPAGGSAA